MPAIQTAPANVAAANSSARYRSQLQAAHLAAKARASKVCRNEPGVLSKYALGEEIALIENAAATAAASHEVQAYIVLTAAADRLKKLI